MKGDRANSIVLSAVYPNPAAAKVNVLLTSPSAEKVNIVVTDAAGKIVLQQAAQVVAGDNNFPVSVISLPAGSYLVKVVCSNGCETAVTKLVKQ